MEKFDLGGELGIMRTRIRLSQATLASLVDASDVSVRSWESNFTKPNAEHLWKLVEVFLSKGAFTPGKELEEAQSLWNRAREDNPRLKASFDVVRFGLLIATAKGLSTEQKGKNLSQPQDLFEEGDGQASLLQASLSTTTVPKDIMVLLPPPAASGLVGREEEQAWLKSCMLSNKVVEISGLGGVGKTTLVADTINEVKDQFLGGIAVLKANEIAAPIDIVRLLIEKFIPYRREILRRPSIKPDQLYDMLRDILDQQSKDNDHVLIVLDNVEPDLIQSEGLQRLCNIFRAVGVSAVMTTRPPVSAQLVHEGRELKTFTNEAATALLTRLLGHRALNVSEQRYAAEICNVVGNHAQAIVLIGAELEFNVLDTLADYLKRLKNQPRIVLDLIDRLDVKTPKGIRLTFSSSYLHLKPAEQHLFTALGTLAGQGSTYRAAFALGAALKQSENETRHSLTILRNMKLILEPTTDARGNGRISIHPIVHELAREILTTSSEVPQDLLHEALARHYLEWIQVVDDELLDADDANIMDVLHWTSSHTSQEAIRLQAQLIYELRWYWYNRFRFEEAFKWLKTGCEAMACLGNSYDERQAELLFARGIQYQQTGDMLNAEASYQKSYELFGEMSKQGSLKTGLGEAISGLAALEQQKGNHDGARQYYERSLAIFREVDDKRSEANALFRLGFLTLRTGNTDDAQRYYTESLAIHRTVGDRWGEGTGVSSLGDVCQQIGKVEQAQTYYEEGLAICREESNRRGEGAVLKALGDLHLQMTGPTRAQEYLTASLELFRNIFDPQSQGVALYSNAFMLRQMGNIKQARDLYTESYEIRVRVNDERGRGFVLKGLGDLTRRTALSAEAMPKAKKQLEQALETSKKVQDRRNQGVALKALGDWYWQADQMDDACREYEQSLVIRRDFHELRGEAITLKALGDCALHKYDFTLAHKYLEQCYTLFTRLKDVRGQGITLHSRGILAWAINDKPLALHYFEQSLGLVQKASDRQSEGTLLYTLALTQEDQNSLTTAEAWYRKSLQIAIEVQAANSIALAREGLGNFLMRHSGAPGKLESDMHFSEATEIYKFLGRQRDIQRLAEPFSKRSGGDEKEKFIRALIYDFDEGPNGQGFALSNERRTNRPLPRKQS